MRVSAIGVDYPLDKYLQTPTTELQYVMEVVVNEEQRVANLAANTAAKAIVISQYNTRAAAGSKDSTPIDPKQYLPYPEWKPIEVIRAEKAKAIKPEARRDTIEVLTKLLKQRAIPMHVYAALMRKED